MAPGVTQFAIFAASEAYRENPEVLRPAQELLAKAPGWRYTYHGLQSEDNATAYLLVGWDDLDSHRALIRTPASSEALLSALQPAIRPRSSSPSPTPSPASPAPSSTPLPTSPSPSTSAPTPKPPDIDLFHIQFHIAPARALAAPCTQIALVRVRKGATDRDRGRLTGLMVHLEKVVSQARSACSWGPSVDREGVLAFVAGWESPEKYQDLVRKSDELAAIARQISEIADLDVKHARLSLLSSA